MRCNKYLIKIKEFELKDEIEKINKANIIIKKLKNNNYKKLIINKCLKFI